MSRPLIRWTWRESAMRRGSSRNPSSSGSSRISSTPNIMTHGWRGRPVETVVQVLGADPIAARAGVVEVRGALCNPLNIRLRIMKAEAAARGVL